MAGYRLQLSIPSCRLLRRLRPRHLSIGHQHHRQRILHRHGHGRFISIIHQHPAWSIHWPDSQHCNVSLAITQCRQHLHQCTLRILRLPRSHGRHNDLRLLHPAQATGQIIRSLPSGQRRSVLLLEWHQLAKFCLVGNRLVLPLAWLRTCCDAEYQSAGGMYQSVLSRFSLGLCREFQRALLHQYRFPACRAARD